MHHLRRLSVTMAVVGLSLLGATPLASPLLTVSAGSTVHLENYVGGEDALSDGIVTSESHHTGAMGAAIVSLGGVARRSVFSNGAESVVFRLRVAAAARLSLSVGVNRNDVGTTASIVLTEVESQERYTLWVDDLSGRSRANRWSPVAIDLSRFAGRLIDLRFVVVAPAKNVTAAQRATADALLRATGSVEWVDDESLMDAVTAVSGSGPAYVFLLAEELARAGVEAGLPADLATKLARETVAGSGELLHRSDLPSATLRQNVTSPGGTTAAALEVLMGQDGMQPLMIRAIAAATQRSKDLAK